jgi:hypothetical protein
MATKASEWAAMKQKVEKAGADFMDAETGNELIAYVDHDGSLALHARDIPASDVPRFIAWLKEWFTEEASNG